MAFKLTTTVNNALSTVDGAFQAVDTAVATINETFHVGHNYMRKVRINQEMNLEEDLKLQFLERKADQVEAYSKLKDKLSKLTKDESVKLDELNAEFQTQFAKYK